MKNKAIFSSFLLLLFLGCATTPSAPPESKEYSTPTGDVKLILDPRSGYTFKSSKYGIIFSLSDHKRFSLWARDLEDFATGKGKVFKDGIPGQRGWGWEPNSGKIAIIHDSYDIANMHIFIWRVSPSEMEKWIELRHKLYHGRTTVTTYKHTVEDLKLAPEINGKKVQFVDRNPDGSDRMFQIVYLELPKNRFFVVQIGNYGTYGNNTKELLELVKSVQLIR